MKKTEIYEQYVSCQLCPRNCKVNRLKNQRGFCGMSSQLMGARAALHYWEEPCLSGTEGSGTVFFTGCNLKCIFCQNQEIALGKAGIEISEGRLAEIFLELQNKKANNINLVTGVMFIPHIREAVRQAGKD
ncbi:MAG: 4Fe-4S cluster-binding domain-containing protein, partial [Lachnospiraceae bacterium]